MGVWHPKPPDGIALEVELDEHHWFASDDPAVVTRLDGDDLRGLVLDDAAVGVLDVNLAADEKANVRVHAEVGANDRLHVDRPAEPRRIDHAFDARLACSPDLETHVSDFSEIGAFHRRKREFLGRRLRCWAAPRYFTSGLPGWLASGLFLCHG